MQCIGPPVAMVCADIGAFRTNQNEGCGDVKVEPEDLGMKLLEQPIPVHLDCCGSATTQGSSPTSGSLVGPLRLRTLGGQNTGLLCLDIVLADYRHYVGNSRVTT